MQLKLSLEYEVLVNFFSFDNVPILAFTLNLNANAFTTLGRGLNTSAVLIFILNHEETTKDHTELS